ncbi:MAG: glycerophosphodiester phosphodiesterase [Actinobacteria bacterium]|jgi:glycerophosphoryl diester phosphodiesterase|nr:glycerophosphodiester phosphodiesterase [Actinomycetota bacterium]
MKIYAHRGFSGKFPEGSKTAYLEAVKAGADGFECDIRITKDGIPVCFHDRTTKRITGRSGFVSRLTLSQMRERYEVITLEELLKLSLEKKCDLVIETKHPVVRGRKVEKKVAKIVDKYSSKIAKSEIRVVLISFSYLAVKYLAKTHVDVGWVVKRKWKLRFAPTKIIAFDIEKIRKGESNKYLKGKELFLWTVNTKSQFREAEILNPSAIITDRPDWMRASLSSRP